MCKNELLMQQKQSRRTAGFTIVEVSFSLLFVAFILVFLTAMLLSIISTYNKGVWTSKVGQAIRQMNQDIVDSSKYGVLADTATKNGKVRRLCVNGISYMWNTQSDFENLKKPGGATTLPNHWATGNSNDFRLVRVRSTTNYCTSPDKYPSRNGSSTGTSKEDVQILLGSGIAIQELNVSQGAGSNRQIPLLSITGVVSTEGSNAPVKVDVNNRVVDQESESTDPNNPYSWQCGDWIDNSSSGIKGVRDSADTFRPSKGQFCSWSNINMVTYERSIAR